jgi:hypothetical protein
MANTSGKAYGLTLLCPIRQDDESCSYSNIVYQRLSLLPRHYRSPMAKVPNTYLCRLYVLNDVFYQGHPAREEHLKSKYLVFCCNFHGDRDHYLKGMWEAIQDDIEHIWEHCIHFDLVNNAQDFIAYVTKCQVKNNLFFNGSTDDSLEEQLKSLYLKQEFSRFAYNNQGKNAVELQQAFKEFVAITQPANVKSPSWYPGMTVESLGHAYDKHVTQPLGATVPEPQDNAETIPVHKKELALL